MKKNKKTIYKSIRKETAPPTKTFKTRKGELPRNAKHKGRDDACQHPNREIMRMWGSQHEFCEYYCRDCGAEW